jgi:hypothetical protein
VEWTVEQALGLAPDSLAARAGRELATPRRWLSAGATPQLVWGETQGSAREPYRVAVDLNGPAFTCSCPSRKVPCKHALGLLLMHARAQPPVPPGEAPEWLANWLSTRHVRATTKNVPADPERAARDQAERVRRRDERIQAGVEDLDRWLQDFARAGLAEMAARPWSTFDQMAARLVDAQAPGLARMVRDLGALPHTQTNWPERMLIALGKLTLLVEAWRQLDTLDADLRAEVRGLVGINEPREAVLAQPPVHDTWDVVGRRLLEGERMRVQRTWLWGTDSRRWALLLEFSAGGQPLDRTWLPGTRVEASLCFYPGSTPLRALVLGSDTRVVRRTSSLPAVSAAEMTRRFAELLGANPWLERLPVVLANVVPERLGQGEWVLADAEQASIPLAGDDGWQLLALSGGRPIDVAGEWDGYRLWPLSVQTEGELSALREQAVA